MSSQGSLIVRVYTSDAFLPLRDVPVVISQDGKLLAIRRTDSSGLTEPLPVDTPDEIESLSPGYLKPYATVDIQVEYPGYGGILAEGVQIFPGVETIQGLQLIPVTSAGTTVVREPAQDLREVGNG